MVPMKQQSERFVPDYSQRIYGYGGMLPRFGNKEKRAPASHRRCSSIAGIDAASCWNATRIGRRSGMTR